MRLRLREPLLYRWLRLKRALDRQPRPTSRPRHAGHPRRILAISLHGARRHAVIDARACAPARLTYPQAHITLLVHPSLLALFTGLAEVDELIPYDGKWRSFGRTASRQLKGYDPGGDLPRQRTWATPLAYLSGARHIFKLLITIAGTSC